MDEKQQIIQRYCDGECSRAEADAVRRLITHDIVARRIYEDISSVDRLLHAEAEQHWQVESDSEQLTGQIMSVIPEWTPQRHLRINTGFMLLIGLLSGMALSIVAYRYSSDVSSLTSLILMTCICVAGAATALLLSWPVRSPLAARLRHLTASSIDLTRLQLLGLRCAALMLVIVAVWLWSGSA